MNSPYENRPGRVNNRWTEVGVDVAWRWTPGGTLLRPSIVADHSVAMPYNIVCSPRNCAVYSHSVVEFNCANVFNAHCTLNIPRNNLRKIVNHQHCSITHVFLLKFCNYRSKFIIYFCTILHYDILRLRRIEFCLKIILRQAASDRSEKYLKSSVPFSFCSRKEKLFTPVLPSFAPQSICFSSDNFLLLFPPRHLVGANP